ncbi:MAG: hypothetical protein KAI79_01225 [Bacteroidales bacterium]|nr:hypothetical protein [Bacteroidales bacterium]
MKITKFYETDYIDAASYDNLRKIASVVDGLKNSGHKVLHTMLQKNITADIKVSRLQSSVSEFTDYLHGEDNLGEVISNMGRRFIGTNQLPLIKAEGNFGKRFKPKASAARYIMTAKESYIDKIFSKHDYPLLKHQTFEGLHIEPRYYVPVIPMLLVNGAMHGVTSGFYQNILPRKYSDIIKMTKEYIQNKRFKIPSPGFDGFKGVVTKYPGVKNKWQCTGVWEKTSPFIITVTELPIGYDLNSYKKYLNKLEDDKIIQSYTNKSTKEVFRFIIKVNRAFMKDKTNSQITACLGLNTTFVEHFNVMGQNNRILEYTSPEEAFEEYARIRLEYYIERKKLRIDEITKEMKLYGSKYFFIKGVVDESIKVFKKSKEEIIDQLIPIENIIEDEGFDYLLNMPIISLTPERMVLLMDKIKQLSADLVIIKSATPEDMWLNDILELEESVKKARK